MENNQIAVSPAELLIELHFLPCLDYMTGLLRFDQVRIEAAEHYQKQSYRNRCYVLTANKVDCLTVPVLNGTHKQPVRDVRIDYRQSWQDRHWRCLQSAYGKAPFFEYYAPYFEPVLKKTWTFLFDLNLELLTLCLKWVGGKAPLLLTECYEKHPAEKIFDARSRMHAQNKADNYVFYQARPYYQNFGLEFVPNLSIIDLLFCQGPAANEVLKASRN